LRKSQLGNNDNKSINSNDSDVIFAICGVCVFAAAVQLGNESYPLAARTSRSLATRRNDRANRPTRGVRVLRTGRGRVCGRTTTSHQQRRPWNRFGSPNSGRRVSFTWSSPLPTLKKSPLPIRSTHP